VILKTLSSEQFVTYLRSEKSKAKIEELETNSKMKNIRDLYKGISDFKKGHQPRPNIVKDEKGDLVADFYSILARWRNYFSQLLNLQYMGLMILGRPWSSIKCKEFLD
jgi:hypothetical protein